MIPRPLYTKKILSYKGTPFVKILTGVRRCGKSTILKMLAEAIKQSGVSKDRILHYSFDSLEHEDLKTAKAFFAELKQRISLEGKTYLFLDEIQEVESWEKAVNSLMTEYDVDMYVTGSNSRMMSSEISTYLTGRYIQFQVFPLSFSEYISFRRHYRTKCGESYDGVIEEIDGSGYGGGIHEQHYYELSRYIRFGGFPAIHLQDYTPDDAYPIVRDIYNSTIFTDIVKRNEIRRIDQLERIVRFVFDNVGRTFSAASIARYLKSENRTIDNETVYSYLSKLESAYIINRCSRYDVQGKEILKTQEKFYLADTAFRYSVLGYSPDSVSAMLENVIYLELRRRGYAVFVGKIGDTEIDFAATKQEKKLYIQVTQQIGSPETEQREYGRLLDIHDNYPKYVLRTDLFGGGSYFGEADYKGIKTMHVADFLLSEEF